MGTVVIRVGWLRIGVGWALLMLATAVKSDETQPEELRGELVLTEAAQEQEIKSVFLFRFLQMVDWPELAFAAGDSPIVVGILDDEEEFARIVAETVRGERVQEREIIVRHATNLRNLRTCHMLFVSGRAWSRNPTLLAELNGFGTLTVGESPGFVERGGMINLYLVENSLRFEICPEAVGRADIKIRSRLLSLARIVPAPTPDGAAP